MEIQWRHHSNESIQLRWHGSFANIEVFNGKRSIAYVENKLSPINFHFAPSTGYTFAISPAASKERKSTLTKFDFASSWLNSKFEMILMVDDSWSVGPIDFARQIDTARMMLQSLNPQFQKSAVILYSHRTRVLKKFQDSIGTGAINLISQHYPLTEKIGLKGTNWIKKCGPSVLPQPPLIRSSPSSFLS